MGAHTISLPIKLQNEAIELLGRVVYMLAAEETLYRGFIYLGLMNTSDGLQILECNCRLGDPEAQVILASTGGNFAELCVAAAAGDLTNVKAPRQKQEALCVVLASAEYPASSSSDNPIVGIEEAERRGAIIFHASTALRKGNFTTNKGGRILNSVGRGKDISEAYQVAYGGAHAIQYDGKKFRNDIGNALVFV
jgi:phosphoribosylamine--glycine ligase